MKIGNNYEADLVFQVETENKKENKTVKTKKILKLAKENLNKLVFDRINGKTGEC
jgi:hypothetical protein